MRNITWGEAAFEAYRESICGYTHDGKKLPDWNNLTKQTQEAWEASAKAALEYAAQLKEKEKVDGT